jgi:hypothetical protein
MSLREKKLPERLKRHPQCNCTVTDAVLTFISWDEGSQSTRDAYLHYAQRIRMAL